MTSGLGYTSPRQAHAVTQTKRLKGKRERSRQYLYGIVKAPDKVTAETHKKMRFADVLKALSGARIFSQRQGKQRRQYLYGIVKLYDDVFAERVRSGECFQCGGEVQKKEKFPRCRVVPFYKPACAGWVNSCPLLLPSPKRGGLTSARRTRYPV